LQSLPDVELLKKIVLSPGCRWLRPTKVIMFHTHRAELLELGRYRTDLPGSIGRPFSAVHFLGIASL
jgi:hypothetical protein